MLSSTFEFTKLSVFNLNPINGDRLFMYYYRPRVMSFLVMTMPAADKPNHVMAYPTCTAGVTLNSPSLSAVGTKGRLLECES